MGDLPRIKTPMAATQVARASHRPGWVYEEKVDGWRVLAYKDVGSSVGTAGICLKVKEPHYREGERGWEPQKS